MNNATVRSFEFEVSGNVKPGISGISASPVPARTSARFVISHNMPGSLLNLRIEVYDIKGKMRWIVDQTASSSAGIPITVDWDLTDTGGRRLPPGVYIYKVGLRTEGSGEATQSKKLVILAQ